MGERGTLAEEVCALVEGGHAARLMRERPRDICSVIFELEATRGFDQRSVYHAYDVFDHTAHVCAAAEAFTAGLATTELRWAALLHDVGKPRTFSLDEAGHGHFFCHPAEGARIAAVVLRRLGRDERLIARTCALIRLHDEKMGCDAHALRRLLSRLHGLCPNEEVSLCFQLFDLCRSDAVSKCEAARGWAHELDAYTKLLRQEVKAGAVYREEHLALGADEIYTLSHARSRLHASMLAAQLLQAVMAGELPNERDELRAFLEGGELC